MSNLLTTTQLHFINWKLSKDLMSADKLITLPKVTTALHLIIEIFGKGVVFM